MLHSKEHILLILSILLSGWVAWGKREQWEEKREEGEEMYHLYWETDWGRIAWRVQGRLSLNPHTSAMSWYTIHIHGRCKRSVIATFQKFRKCTERGTKRAQHPEVLGKWVRVSGEAPQCCRNKLLQALTELWQELHRSRKSEQILSHTVMSVP